MAINQQSDNSTSLSTHGLQSVKSVHLGVVYQIQVIRPATTYEYFIKFVHIRLRSDHFNINPHSVPYSKQTPNDTASKILGKA